MARARSQRDIYPSAVLVGVGLIGASLMRDLRTLRCVRHVIGFGRDARNLRLAKKLGIIDEIGSDLGEALRGADLVMLATPVRTICEFMPVVARDVRAATLVIDVGSTKSSIADAADRYFPHGNFVPCHPIAGHESSGASSSVRGLFKAHLCVLTPAKLTAKASLMRARRLWMAVGAKIIMTDPRTHDEKLAASSHLPQIAASALMNVVGKTLRLKDLLPFLGSGFKDTTRLAGSEPQMWTQIALENRDRLVPLLHGLADDINTLCRHLVAGDEGGVFGFFKAAAQFRKIIP